MKIRVMYNDHLTWETIDDDQVDKIILSPFAYFNVVMKNGNIFSADKLDATR